MTLELLIDPKSGRRWPTHGSRVLFRHLSPTRWYIEKQDDTFVKLASAHGWAVCSQPATTEEQIEFCRTHAAAWYDYDKQQMLWRPVSV